MNAFVAFALDNANLASVVPRSSKYLTKGAEGLCG